jgi:acyl transferase domain-containing protein/NADPH:quinone reductase-like Zn-dependent oxidoreductase/aryl carrier-like protein
MINQRTTLSSLPSPHVHGSAPSQLEREPIAIVGMGCRFPGRAHDPASFWKHLMEARDVITPVPPERWSEAHFYHPQRGRPGTTQARWGGFIEQLEEFDARAFGISPREAARMDPQQRMLLETAWEALEDGGVPWERVAGSRTAVFVGISSWDYAYQGLSYQDRGVIDPYSNTGGSHSIAANRISFCFDLRGPSSAVDTACSSALLAVHLACQAIWNEECPLALAGGANALLLPDFFVAFSQLNMLSPTGRCRAFDAAADGFVRSEGAGMVLLKPLHQAIADRDRVYAVIRGSAVNQDGRTPGMTVPSQSAQESLVAAACQSAGVAPRQIDYVEAHGTGTLVGDPIEARALGQVLSEGRPANQPCILGSVKTNIGHLEAGAGVASLMKVALAMHHGMIPPNLHFRHPNPEIDFDSLKLRVPVEVVPWPRGHKSRWAGINAFGYGGTNVHVILQDSPAPSPVLPADNRTFRSGADGPDVDNGHTLGEIQAQLIPLTARSPEALQQLAIDARSSLEQLPDEVSFQDWVGNLVHRRSHHEYRLALVAHSREQLVSELKEREESDAPGEGTRDHVTGGRVPRVAFVCSGQGPQWWSMGRQLLKDEPVFRRMIRRCDKLIQQLGFWSLWDELTADESRSRMADTAISQPAIFSLQVALAELWRSWGVEPVAVVGHSVGEVAAAYLCGVFTLEDAVRVIYQRGRCMGFASSDGGMLAAGLTMGEAEDLLAGYGDQVTIAAINSPTSLTLSGDPRLLDRIADQLQARQVFQRRLHVQYAFHSAQMDPIRTNLLAALQGIRPQPGKLPLISTVTGQQVEGTELGPEYWWHNVRDRVRFADATARLTDFEIDMVVELSPHPVLAASVAECFQSRERRVTVLPSLRRGDDEQVTMLRSAGALFTRGYPLNWNSLAPVPHRHVTLPRYPWQRERLWFETDECRRHRHPVGTHPLLGRSTQGPARIWEQRLDLGSFPYLADHRVERTVVFPAAGQVELVLAAAAEVAEPGPCLIEDLELTAALTLMAERACWLETHHDQSDGTVRVYARGQTDADSWALHGTARIRPWMDQSAAASSLSEIRDRCTATFTKESCYRYCQALGLDYGPAFQGIREGWKGPREALARVELPETLRQESDSYWIHPALLDACFQVTVTADNDFDEFVGPLYLPVGIERIVYHRRPEHAVWGHARIREKSEKSLVADLNILDHRGELLVEIRGLTSRRTAGISYREKLSELLYDYQWHPAVAPDSTVPETEAGAEFSPADDVTRTNSGGGSEHAESFREMNLSEGTDRADEHWLLLADRTGIGEKIARQLERQGVRCTLAFHGPSFKQHGKAAFELAAGNREDMEAVLAACFQEPARLRGMIHLWNLDAPDPSELSTQELEAWQRYGTISLLQLIQVWDAIERPAAPSDDAPTGQTPADASPPARSPLLIVTRGAQAVGQMGPAVSIAQSPVIGLGRVVISEQARLRTKLVDLDPHDLEDAGCALWREVTWAATDGVLDDEDEVAWRNSQRWVRRYLPVERSWIASPARETAYRLELDPPGTLDGLQLRTSVRPPPGRGEVEIEVRAAALNFSDVMKVLGLYPGMSELLPRLGAECSGVISRLGPDVQGLAVGDAVVAVAPNSFASHVVTRAELTARKPSNLTFEQAAGLPIAFLTASHGMEYLGRLQPGERVLIHSATGGVGLAAIQLAQRVGAEVFATAGTEEKRAYLRNVGIDWISDSRSLRFAADVRRWTAGRGVDMILNSLAGEAIRQGVELLADYGRFLEIGKRDIYRNMPLGLRPFRKNLSFHGIDLDQLMQDRPQWLGTSLRRLMEQFQAGIWKPLPYRVFPIGEIRQAFRWMQQGKHIGKVVLSFAHPPDTLAVGDEPLALREDATYLIVGGLGGFGCSLARWLVAHGARRLALMSRRGGEVPEAKDLVRELEPQGAQVSIYQGDVSEPGDVEAVVEQIQASGAPLRGLFHAAMVLEDGLLQNLDPHWMARVMAPKVQGGWNLHQATQHLSLDYFVLFSSLSSVFGHAGQGNYAAANAFLDQLAHYRQTLGLPCLTVNWGYLGDVGYLAERPQLGERLRRQGVLSFTVRQALDCLQWGLGQRRTQMSVMHVDWKRWRGLGVSGPVSPRFRHLLVQADDDWGGTTPGLASAAVLRGMPLEQRTDAVLERLRDKVARVLGTVAERLDTTTPLLDLGLDSLMAVELRNWIEEQFHTNVSIVELVRSPSLRQVAEQLAAQLTKQPEQQEVGDVVAEATVVATTPDPSELLTRLDQLSGDEVDNLLSTLLGEETGPSQ